MMKFKLGYFLCNRELTKAKPLWPILEFFLNVFSEFAEFSDKKLSLQQKD